jgi:hypothetical protein
MNFNQKFDFFWDPWCIEEVSKRKIHSLDDKSSSGQAYGRISQLLSLKNYFFFEKAYLTYLNYYIA